MSEKTIHDTYWEIYAKARWWHLEAEAYRKNRDMELYHGCKDTEFGLREALEIMRKNHPIDCMPRG